MSRAKLLGRRVVARRGLLLLVWLLVAGLAASTAVSIGYVRGAAVDGARDGLSAAPPDGRGLLLLTRTADTAAAAGEQDARVAAAIARHLGDTPAALYRETRTEGVPAAAEGLLADHWVVSTPDLLAAPDSPGAAPSGSGPDPRRDGPGAAASAGEWSGIDPAVADTVAGSWPGGTAEGEIPEAAVQADAARAAGIEVGDRLRIGGDPASDDPASDDAASGDAVSGDGRDGLTVTVSGLWRVTDGRDDSRWFGDPLVTAGSDGEDRGPILVAAADLERIDTTPFARWLVVPDAGRATPDVLERSIPLADALDADLADDDAVAFRGFQVLGSLGDTARTTLTAIRATEAVALVALVLLVVTGLVALVQVARLLAAVRAAEVALLVSRGAGARTILIATAAEGAALAGSAAAAGGVVAAAALRVLVPSSGQWPVVLAAAGGVAVGATAVIAVVAGVQARAAVRRQATDRSGRVRRIAAAGTVALTVVGAAVCGWQLARYGSPSVVTPAGIRVDPLAAAAPALLLAAASVVALAVLGPVTAAWSGLAARGRGAVPVLAARQVARRLVVYAVPVVLLVLAGGATTFSGAYAGTSAGLSDDAAVLRTGADVRVALPAGQEGADVVAAYAGGTGATAAAAVLTDEALAGETPLTLVAAPAGELPRVMRSPGDAAGVDRMAAAITEPPGGAPDRPAGNAPGPDAPGRAAPAALPVVVTEHLARTLDLAGGDVFEVSHLGVPVAVEVVATTAVVPGVPERDVVVADAEALTARRDAEGADPAPADEIWLAAGDAAAPGQVAAVAAAARGVADARPGDDGTVATVTTAGDAAGSSAVSDAFRIAAVAAVVLALTGVVAAVVAMLHERRGEVVVLRAAGLGPGAQARARATELVVVGIAATALGALAGWGVARFAVGGLARAAITGIDVEIAARFAVATPWTVAVLGATLGGLLVVAAAVGARVAAQARDTTYREEVR